MSVLNRDVFNEYNLNYNPVGLRGISLPDSFFSPALAPELSLEELQEIQNRQALNRAGIMAIDDAGITIPAYENFARVARPGFNLDFAKQLGRQALTSAITAVNPIVGLIARGLGSLPGRTGIVGGVDLRDDTTFDTFGRSTSFADFAQRMRNKRAREEAAERGARKQSREAFARTRASMFADRHGGGGSGGGTGSGANEGGSGADSGSGTHGDPGD